MNDLTFLLKSLELTSKPANKLAYSYISNEEELNLSFEEIKKTKKFSIDCEGGDLSRKGSLSTIQIKIESGKIYIFDYLLLKEHLPKYLRTILEDESFLKITWDFRNDYDCLYHQFYIQTKNIIDVQLIEFWSKSSLEKNSSQLGREWLKLIQAGKYSWKELYLPSLKAEKKSINFSEFMNRPLTEKLLEYCANDVDIIFEKFRLYEAELTVKDYSYFLKFSEIYARMFSNLTSRKYDKMEENEVMPIFIFITSFPYRDCNLCGYRVPEEAFSKNGKKCYRCLLKKKLIEREENIQKEIKEMRDYGDYGGSDDEYD